MGKAPAAIFYHSSTGQRVPGPLLAPARLGSCTCSPWEGVSRALRVKSCLSLGVGRWEGGLPSLIAKGEETESPFYCQVTGDMFDMGVEVIRKVGVNSLGGCCEILRWGAAPTLATVPSFCTFPGSPSCQGLSHRQDRGWQCSPAGTV